MPSIRDGGEHLCWRYFSIRGVILKAKFSSKPVFVMKISLLVMWVKLLTKQNFIHEEIKCT